MVRGGLLLYYFPSPRWFRDAATIMDHVSAFERYSRFGIRSLNTDTLFPQRIANLDFQLVVVHYSVFGAGFYPLTEDHLAWLRTSRGYKVVFPQDENRYCGHRFWFCDEVGFDVIYTLLEPSEFEKVYASRTRVPKIRTTLPGYVSEQMLANARRLAKPHSERPIDVGYRARELPAYCGRGALEKPGIGSGFIERVADSDLELDIKVNEGDRLYGMDWAHFLSRCKAVLGVESGVSVFDIDDLVIDEYERLSARGEVVSVEDLSEAAKQEDRIYYRALSPRHFEAAAMRTCQILFEGSYSGVLHPMRHFIPLRKDFSNLDAVLRLFRDPRVRGEITENAHRELIESRRYGYDRFIEGFDTEMVEDGLEPGVTPREARILRRAVKRGSLRRRLGARCRWFYHRHSAAVRHRLIQRPRVVVRWRILEPVLGRLVRIVRRALRLLRRVLRSSEGE